MSKFNLFILSLWLLFACVAILTAYIPICFGNGCAFIGVKPLLLHNITSGVSVLLMAYGVFGYLRFKYAVSGTPNIPMRVVSVESESYQHLVFLATYIIPLTAVDFENVRSILVFWILIAVMGTIYVKTEMFFANPSLALLNFKLYKVEAEFKGNIPTRSLTLMSKNEIRVNDKVKYYKLSSSVYLGETTTNDEK